ncbi:signal transduction histidine kinase [Labedaea rhizosphaerae]|uniref:histidine kinase n=1 Tax=Labedaea rhizosphaerae TaxID=598644 RepID=A0A4R6SGR0_LABRH|nr:signal transduction histidine kinase [Labedaea rhizosphaerae]
MLSQAKRRIENSCARLGVPYPWWVPAWSTGAGTVLAAAALIQRRDMPIGLLVPAGLLALGPLLIWLVTGRLLAPWMESVLVTAGVVLLMTHPLDLDLAPWMLTVVAGEVAATSPIWVALVVAAMGATVPVVAGVLGTLPAAPVHVVGVLLGLEVGVTLRWQIRALAAERAKRLIERTQAAAEERQRIAREVHDVVGHSLSITLLHVTAARHALQHDGDVDEAIDALAEAERIGRSAMADIRRSVGLLPSNRPNTHALPGIEEIATLVERTRGAGVDVRYVPSGDLSAVEPACGLGLYRIAQESLGNIIRHAPESKAEVRLVVGPRIARLTVRNTLSTVENKRGTSGNGLDGMATRAAQLGAELTVGPRGGDWVIDVTVPLLTVSAP